jgi:hypothetical protein
MRLLGKIDMFYFYCLLILLLVVPILMPSFRALAVFLALYLGLVLFLWPSLPTDPGAQSGPLIARVLIGMASASAFSGVALRAISLWVGRARSRTPRESSRKPSDLPPET